MSFLKIYSPGGLQRFLFTTTILPFLFNTLCPVLRGKRADTEPKPQMVYCHLDLRRSTAK